MDFPPLILKRNEDRRLRAGHLWVFSNEVDSDRTPLDSFLPGQAVSIQGSSRGVLGTGYVNPHSLICARLVSRDPTQPFGSELIGHRIRSALDLRSRIFEEPFYRLVYGESDGLPGLVIDRYGDIAVAQLNTAGMEVMREHIIGALIDLLDPTAILLRNDAPSRALEGLASSVETAFGAVPGSVVLAENGARFEVPLVNGQKTGWYYDHRVNRARTLRYIQDQRVLDVFSYLGAWGIQAAVAGARQVFCVEASTAAADYLRRNAALNQVEDRLAVLHGDAFELLKRLRSQGERFDVVILDPPALVKRRKDIKEGFLAYERLNRMAMLLLRDNGILITASCSYHLPQEAFLDAIRRAAQGLERGLQVLEQGHQAPDHPVHPAVPETDYLKTYLCRVTDRM